MKQNEEIILIQAAAAGDIESFNRLCERYYPAIVAICYSQLADRDLAEDAAQEALFIAYRDLSKLKKISLFGRWLAGISRNVAIDMAKRRKKETFISTEDCGSLSKEQNGQNNNVDVIRSIVAALPVKLREIIYLRFYNQMSYQEIAKLSGISQQAVNGRLRRAKKLIVKKLSRHTSIEVDL